LILRNGVVVVTITTNLFKKSAPVGAGREPTVWFRSLWNWFVGRI
jgi:hypothetical protein